MMRILVITCILLGGLPAGATRAATPVLPHIYRSGVNLAPYGGTVSRAVTYWKGVVYVSVDAEDCHTGTQWSSATVYAVDVSDPDHVRYLSKTDEGGCKANGLIVWEDKLYVAKWFGFLTIWDVSAPGVFGFVGEYVVPNQATWSIDVSGPRAYLGMSIETLDSFYIIDVSNPQNPIEISHTDWMGGPAVRGSYSFYADGTAFKVLNISDERNPWPMAAVDVGQHVGEIRLRDHYAYATWGWYPDAQTGMVIFDVNDPFNPVEVGRWVSGSYGFRGITFLGDCAFLPTSGNGFFTVDISNPAQPVTLAQSEVPYYSLELAIAANGPFVYVGTTENGGGVHCFQVLSGDPDHAGPGRWSGCSLGEASWGLQYEGDTLPSAGSSGWTLVEGSEACATAAQGTLRINDNSSAAGSKVKWAHNWDATNSRGATVLARARCASYNTGGGPIGYLANLYLRDGKYAEEFCLLSDRIHASRSNLEYALDGTVWHTYRITTQGSQFQVYVDEGPLPVLSGPLTVTVQQDPEAAWARVLIGSGSSVGQQDVSFDYVYAFANGAVASPAALGTQRPTISVNVADVAGKGSLSGINPASARVMWSTDGGSSWQSSGAAAWQCQYEGGQLPSAASPAWPVLEGSETYASIAGGVLRVNDNSTAPGSKVKWAREWNATPEQGTTVVTRARCASVGGDPTLLGNIYIEDGVHGEFFRIMPDRLTAANAGLSFSLDGTSWHVYRITTAGSQFQVFVDEAPSPVLTGPFLSPSSNRRILFGSGASAATQDIYFDYLRYATQVLLPGQGDAGGPVTVTCTPATSVQPADRGVITAMQIPFDQNSDTLNKVRFWLQDMAGNVGLSPVYTVRNRRLPDFDHDGDVDQDDFGHLQACFTGDGESVLSTCMDADLDGDDDVDEADVSSFAGCMAGPGHLPGC